MSNVVFRASLGFVVLCLLLVSASLYLSDRYLGDYQDRMAVGEVEEAEEYARAAERLDPVSPRPLEARATLLQQQGRAAEAEEALLQAMEREPSDYGLYLSLGNLQLRQMDDPEAAAESYRRALELNPRSSQSATGLAESLMRVGDLQGAREEYERLEELRDLSARDNYNLGRIYVRTGDSEQGLRTLQRAKRQAENEIQNEAEPAVVGGGFAEQIDHAMTEAIVVQGDYTRATRRLEASESEQATAALELIYYDPDAYRESILSDDLS